MAQHIGELKFIRKTIRITEKMEAQVEAFPGVDFSDKFRNMVVYCSDNLPAINKEYYALNQEIARLHQERMELLQDMQQLKQCKKMMLELTQTVDKLQTAFVGEMIDKQHKNIAAMIEREGFVPTPDTLEKIRLLNERTGKEHMLSDICRAYKEHAYDERDILSAEYVKDIYHEFQNQELAKQPPEPEEEMR